MFFFVTEFYRDNARQFQFKRDGFSKAGPGVLFYNFGLAVDIVHTGKLWDLSKPEWDIIGAIGKETARKMNLKVEWGGDWSFWDPAHWQIAGWRKVRDAQMIIPHEAVVGNRLFDF